MNIQVDISKGLKMKISNIKYHVSIFEDRVVADLIKKNPNVDKKERKVNLL